MPDQKQENPAFSLPEGRLINHSLFTRDVFRDGTPAYKAEIAFEPSDLDGLAEKLATFARDKWGAGAYDDYYDGKIGDPIKNGDAMAKKRETDGKPGDSYKGKDVLRLHTQFNKHGENAAGGARVYAPDLTEIDITMSDQVYAGCYGCSAVQIGAYQDNEGRNALTLYLCAFQKTRDGDKLFSAADHSALFSPVAGGGKPEAGGRRRRPRGE